MAWITGYINRLHGLNKNARLFLFSSLMGGLSYSVFALIFNLYLLSLGYRQDFIGLLAGIPPMVTALLSLPAGSLGNRIGHRRALLLSTLLITLGTLGVAMFSQAAALIFFMGLAGLSGALWQVVSAPFMVAQSSGEDRAHFFSIQFSISTFAGVLGSLIGGALPAFVSTRFALIPDSYAVYQIVLAVSAALGLISFLPLLWVAKIEPMRPAEPASRAARTSLRTVFKLASPNIFMGLGAGLFIPFLNVFFKLEFGTPDALLGLLFAGGAVTMAVASLVAPALASRWGKVRMVVWTQTSSLPFLFALGFIPLYEIAAVAFLVRGALMVMGAPIYTLFIMEQVDPETRARVNGWATMLWNFCYAISSWVSGLMQKTWGFDPIFLAAGAFYVGCILAQYFLFTPLERSTEERPPHWEEVLK